MAYRAGSISGSSDGAVTSFSLPLPPHQSGDLLLCLVTQDGGTGTITISGWTAIGTHAASAGVRSGWFGKIATSSSETDPAISSTLSDDIAATIYVVRDADTTSTVANAIHASAKNDTTTGAQASAALTTTVDNCLILYSWSFDGASSFCATSPDKIILTDRDEMTANCAHLVGYFQQQAQGAVPSQDVHNNINDGGTAWTIAIKLKSGGALGRAMTQCAETLALLSGVGTDTNLTAASLSTIAATIGGKTVNTTGLGTTPGETEAAALQSPGGYYETYTSSASVTDEWMGVAFTLASTASLTGKIVSILWGAFASAAAYGAEGFIVVFSDGTNWAAFRLLLGSQIVAGPVYHSAIKVDAATPYASSGSINWSSVTKIGIGYHRTTAAGTSGKVFPIKRIQAIQAAAFVGGSAAAPIAVDVIGGVFAGAGLPGVFDKQGAGQAFLRAPLQIGNGSIQTYYDGGGTSIEFPGAYVATGDQRYWNVPELGCGVTVYASATDTIRFSNGTLRTPLKQEFALHASSSPSAIYDFSGATFVGWAITWRSGITCNAANFVGCYKITANGGTFDGCVIEGCLDTIALTTADPEEVSNCEFISGGTGHAIEITTPGTYSFVGNTFSGYGTAGSTDAAVYNNSGGAVTLNISGGGGTPTVRNGTSASTTINNNVALTLDNLVTGSAIRIEKVSDGSLVEFRTAASTSEVFSVPASVNYRVKVRKATSAPLYKPYESQTGALSADTSIYVSQIPD